MRTATGLMLIAIGAILAFAVRGHPSFVNLQIVGWVIILTGVAGMILPRRGYGWLRRRLVLRRGTGGPVTARAGQTLHWTYRRFRPGSSAGAEGRVDPVIGEPVTTTGQPTGEVAEEYFQA